jgi:hypothetical protein
LENIYIKAFAPEGFGLPLLGRRHRRRGFLLPGGKLLINMISMHQRGASREISFACGKARKSESPFAYS